MTNTVDRILDVAESNIRQRGYHAVSFRDLASQVGIRSSSIHHHFPRKEDLAVIVLERFCTRFFESLEERCRLAKTGPEKVEAFIQCSRDGWKDSGLFCLCGMVSAESGGLPKEITIKAEEFFSKCVAWLAEALSGELPEVQRRIKALHVLSALQGAMLMSLSLDDDKVFDAVNDDLIKIFAV